MPQYESPGFIGFLSRIQFVPLLIGDLHFVKHSIIANVESLVHVAIGSKLHMIVKQSLAKRYFDFAWMTNSGAQKALPMTS